MSTKKPEVGQRVELVCQYGIDQPRPALVRDQLSTQFTAVYTVPNSTGGWKDVVEFRFYNDHGSTWK